MAVLLHWLLLSSAATTSLVSSMGDRWAWGFTDWALTADRKIDAGQFPPLPPSLLAQLTRVILDETIDAFVPEDDEELLREPRKVKKDLEPRNFIKDKLCELGLADVSIEMYC